MMTTIMATWTRTATCRHQPRIQRGKLLPAMSIRLERHRTSIDFVTSRLLVLLAAAIACQPATTRPAFLPRPEALGAELRLSVSDATRRLAESLRADSIPVRTVRLRDGYIETPWFASRTG